MATLSKTPGNVKVTIGTPMSASNASGTTYQYQLVGFSGVRTEIMSGTSVSDTVIKNTLKSQPQVIFFQTLGNASSSSSEQVGSKAWQIIKNYPSGIINKNGAVMQQIIIPQAGDDIDNGIQGAEGQEAEGNDDGEPINWTCNVSSPRCGFRASTKQGCGFIAMSNGRNSSDSDQYGDRTYTCTPQEKGAFALMLDYVGSPTIKENDPKPKTTINLNGSKGVIIASQTSDCLVDVNGNKATGSLTASDSGYDVPHREGNSQLKPTSIFVYPVYNGLVVTSNISASTKDETSILARVSSKSYNAFSELNPTLQEFPNEFAGSESTSISVDASGSTKFDFGNIKVQWTNSWGNFAYCPIIFAKKTKFSYYFKGQYKSTSSSGSGTTFTYLAVPIFYDNGGKANMSSNKYTATCVSSDSETMTSIWKFDFEISGEDNKPGQMFGFVKILKRTGKYSDVLCGNGDYSYSAPSNTKLNTQFNTGLSNWYDCITNVQTRVSLDGISGSITLDKYAMYSSLSTMPVQNIGAITLNAINGPYGSSANGNSVYGLGTSTFFKGFVLSASNSVSESSATISLQLCGMDKKLEDMKLVNCPFWDGDKLFGTGNDCIMQYFRNYTGCSLPFQSSFCNTSESNFRVPASFNYQKPAVDFTLGTSCLQALRQLANMCNLQFVIQPNGIGYFYEMDDIGAPIWLKNSSVIMSYSNSDIISFNIQPFLQNKFNTFLTMGYLVKNTPRGMVQPTQVSVSPGMLLDKVTPSGSNFPWSRIKTTAAPGYVTRAQLQKFHNANKKFGTADIYQGSVTVPGISCLALFDKISIDGVTYYITGVEQNIDLQSKIWTTNLSIAKYTTSS